MITEAWAELQHGLEKERDRLRGHSFVSIILTRSFDYEGLSEWIYFGQPQDSAQDACDHVALELIKCVVLYAHSRAHDANPSWVELGQPVEVRWPQTDLRPAVGEVQRVKWGDGTGFNSEQYHGAVFKVDPEEPLTNALIAAIRQEDELVSYLRGKVRSW